MKRCRLKLEFFWKKVFYFDESVAASQSARSLGVIFDEHMFFHAHVSSICRSSFYHLRNLSRIRKYFTKESAEVAVHAFVTSKLDYCNPLLYGLPKYQLQRLQYVQNTAARVVLQVSKFQHITPVLCALHWLPIQYRIIFKILLNWHNSWCNLHLRIWRHDYVFNLLKSLIKNI